MRGQLRELGGQVLPGVANFLLWEHPEGGPGTRELVTRCRRHGLFVRDPGNMGTAADHRMIRLAVKDAETNARMVEILRTVIP